jgi:hypothetical protein
MNTSSALSRLIIRFWMVAILFGLAVSAFADAVIDWNSAMTSYSESLPPPGMPPFVESRLRDDPHRNPESDYRR